jgi:predicted transcriptional regulator
MVVKFPGIRYRELMRLARLTNGVMSYHLGVLEKIGAIKIDRRGGVTRFYPTSMSEYDRSIIGRLRQRTARQIVLFLLQNESITFNDIVAHVKYAPSTVSWHLKKLQEIGLIQAKRSNGHILYKVNQRDEIVRLLSEYKTSFLDNMVDSFVDTWNEL